MPRKHGYKTRDVNSRTLKYDGTETTYHQLASYTAKVIPGTIQYPVGSVHYTEIADNLKIPATQVFPGDRRPNGADCIAHETIKVAAVPNTRLVIKLKNRKLENKIRLLEETCKQFNITPVPTSDPSIWTVVTNNPVAIEYLMFRRGEWIEWIDETKCKLAGADSRHCGRKPHPRVNREFVRNGRYVYGIGPIHVRQRV